MTVTSEVRIDDYVGDGIVTVFPYTFVILDASDLKVFFNLAEQVGGFTVDGVGNPGGGNVTFDVAPADQINIRLSRFVPLTQEIDLTAFDPFPAETVEDGLDNLTFQTQQLQGQIDILAGTVGVISVFGRVGVVTAQLNDYAGSLVGNVPAGAVTATNVQGAINELESLIAGIAAPVDSVFGRVGAVVAQADDYTAIEVANIPAGNITSDNVQDALDELDGLIVAAPVDSVFGRTGAVVADPGDYTSLTALTITDGPFVLGNGADQGYIFDNNFTAMTLRGDTPGSGVSLELFSADADGTDAVSFAIYAVRTGPNDITDTESLTIGYSPARTQFEISTFDAGTGVARGIAMFAQTTNRDQLVLAVNGDVGVGGLPTSPLHVIGATAAGVKIENTGDGQVFLRMDADRGGNGQTLAALQAQWSGTIVAALIFQAGVTAAGAKDDGKAILQVKAGGGAVTTAMEWASSRAVKINNLAGTGSRTVVADANGVLSAP